MDSEAGSSQEQLAQMQAQQVCSIIVFIGVLGMSHHYVNMTLLT